MDPQAPQTLSSRWQASLRLALTSSAIVLVASAATALGEAPSDGGVARFGLRSARASVVFIVKQTAGSPRSVGSGFLVSPDGLIFTNRHVVGAQALATKTRLFVGVPTANDPDDLEYYRAEPVYVAPADQALDFAVIKIARTRNQPAFQALTRAAPDAGEPWLGSHVAVLGYPFIADDQPVLSFNKGNLSSTEVVVDSSRYFLMDAVVNPGNSGGPVLNEAGQAIGVVTLKELAANKRSYALPLSTLSGLDPQITALARAVKPPPGIIPLTAVPSTLHIAPTVVDWAEANGEVRTGPGGLVIDRGGFPYWIRSRVSLPRNFLLTFSCAVEFLDWGQSLFGQDWFLRSLIIRWGNQQKITSILNGNGYAVHFSQARMRLLKGSDRELQAAHVGNSPEPMLIQLRQFQNEISVTVNGQTLISYQDPRPSSSVGPLYLGGTLSRLVFGEVSVEDLGQ